MLTLDRRDCKLGLKATADGKEIDGQEIKTLTVELTDVLLDQRELNALLAEPHAWQVLYNTRSKAVEPYLKCLKALELQDPSEHAHVTILYGLERASMVFTDCKLSKITLTLRDGGETAMSCKVTATPVLDGSLAELFEQLGNAVECEIRAESPAAQIDMPLNNFGEGEQPTKAAAKPKRGRKPSDGATVN